mgnify:CR=1 FL=1|jgi:hypothetical protein
MAFAIKKLVRASLRAAGVATALSLALPAQAAAPGASFDPRNISGFWELPYDGRNIPQADLQPSITPAVIAAQAAKDANSRRWCYFIGMPMAMESPRPIDIRQSAHEVLVNFETRATPRHIYLDRKENMVLDDYDLTSTGDSVGHWEGNTFVVTTVGIDGNKGLTLLPGGGFRTTDSKLTERYRLANNGNALIVTFTWEDPKVFKTPHTYAYRYTRAPKFYEVQTPLDCDPLDKERVEFFTNPPSAK